MDFRNVVISVLIIMVLVPFSAASAREKLAAGKQAPSCINVVDASNPEAPTQYLMAVFLRGLF